MYTTVNLGNVSVNVPIFGNLLGSELLTLSFLIIFLLEIKTIVPHNSSFRPLLLDKQKYNYIVLLMVVHNSLAPVDFWSL